MDKVLRFRLTVRGVPYGKASAALMEQRQTCRKAKQPLTKS